MKNLKKLLLMRWKLISRIIFYFYYLFFLFFIIFQVRTSYLPNEILWGHQFDHNVLIYDKKMGSYQVHHSRVNKTLLDDTPRVSARQLHMRSKRNSSGLSNSTSTDHSPSKKPFKKAQSATNAWRQHHHKLIIITYHINNYSNYSFVSFFGFDW